MLSSSKSAFLRAARSGGAAAAVGGNSGSSNVCRAGGRRALSYYSPTLTERRPGEAGTGSRSSEAGLKVAVFGASGFLGNYVCSELGESMH